VIFLQGFGQRFGERESEARRRDAGTEPQRNDRRRIAGGKAADPSASGMPLVTSALFANGTGSRRREQENALVTAVCFCIKLSSGYAGQRLTFFLMTLVK
jgi:hypothetical protein